MSAPIRERIGTAYEERWRVAKAEAHGESPPPAEPREEGAAVRITDVALPFATVFRLVLFVTIAQALIGGVIVLALVVLDVI